MVRTETRPASYFTEVDERCLTTQLEKLSQIVNIGWEFIDGELRIDGLDKEPIRIGHPRSARAFIDGVLLGYDRGYGDAKLEGE